MSKTLCETGPCCRMVKSDFKLQNLTCHMEQYYWPHIVLLPATSKIVGFQISGQPKMNNLVINCCIDLQMHQLK